MFDVRFIRAHSKELVCCAFFIRRTAKGKHTVYVIVCRASGKNAWQTQTFAVRFFFRAQQSIPPSLSPRNK
jgi:hypothetical protein